MDDKLRRKIIAEWRGFYEPYKTDRTKSVEDVLPAIMTSLGLKDRLQEAQVSSAWKSIVGDFIAQHAKPVSLKNGVLLVQILQPVLRYELSTVQKPRILQALKKHFGPRVVRDIRFTFS